MTTAAKHQPQPCGNSDLPRWKRTSAARLASMFGCSARRVEQVRTIRDHGSPEQVEAITSGQRTINAVYQEVTARLRPRVDPLESAVATVLKTYASVSKPLPEGERNLLRTVLINALRELEGQHDVEGQGLGQ